MKRVDEEKADVGMLELWVGGNNGVQEGHVDKGRGTPCKACGQVTE
jgi:hypothetical protein